LERPALAGRFYLKPVHQNRKSAISSAKLSGCGKFSESFIPAEKATVSKRNYIFTVPSGMSSSKGSRQFALFSLGTKKGKFCLSCNKIQPPYV